MLDVKKIALVMSMILVLLVGCNKETDAEKFKNEYESLNGQTSQSGKKYLNVEIEKDNIIKYVTSDITETHRKTQKNNLFEIFESEFGRPLSPMEFEVINDWDKQGYSEELITAALREAVECNAKNFKYINSILLAWRDKGYKTPNDIIRKSRRESEESNK